MFIDFRRVTCRGHVYFPRFIRPVHKFTESHAHLQAEQYGLQLKRPGPVEIVGITELSLWTSRKLLSLSRTPQH